MALSAKPDSAAISINYCGLVNILLSLNAVRVGHLSPQTIRRYLVQTAKKLDRIELNDATDKSHRIASSETQFNRSVAARFF